MTDDKPIDKLLYVMSRLRDPDGGCPWDLEQDFSSIAPYTIEEAYEVADAITSGDMDELKDELGDLLLQVVYHAQMAREDGHFDFDDVAQGVTDKMIHRHPHVFGDTDAQSAGDVNEIWEQRKEAERNRAPEKHKSALDGITKGIPALLRAEKLQKRAARVGFEWPDIGGVLDKIEEEIAELRAELADNQQRDTKRMEDELGDVFFALVNLARTMEINPESALRHTNNKFEKRFKYIEQHLDKDGKSPSDSTLGEMMALWLKSKDKIAV